MTVNRARGIILAGHILLAVFRFDLIARFKVINDLAFTGKAKTAGKSKVTNKLELNPVGFVLAFILMMITAEMFPTFAVSIMGIVLVGEVMTHPENLNSLATMAQEGLK